MSYIKELLFARQELARHGGGSDLEEYAVALDGEVYDERTVLCASPGRPPDDRSCWVRFDGRGRPFIYQCEGSRGATLAKVCAALGLTLPPPVSQELIERLWAETEPAGPVVETYLRSRDISLSAPPSLRFHPRLWHSMCRSGWPGMVAERLNVAGRRVALHRTFLLPGGGGKAPVEPAKMDLGSTGGTAIRLSPVADELAVGEGIETTLSFMQASGVPGWAAGSAKTLRMLLLPPEVRSVLIAADGDAAGLEAAGAAAARWKAEGRAVRIYPAPAGKDFNDLLREAAPCSAQS